MQWKTYDWKSHRVGQIGEVLDKVEYKCGFCKGAGHMPSKIYMRCTICGGKRTVKVPGLAVICAYCNGGGRSPLNRDISCSICGGKGVVNITSKNIEICPVCKGRGREKGSSLSCLKCKGKGVIVNEAMTYGAKRHKS